MVTYIIIHKQTFIKSDSPQNHSLSSCDWDKEKLSWGHFLKTAL